MDAASSVQEVWREVPKLRSFHEDGTFLPKSFVLED